MSVVTYLNCCYTGKFPTLVNHQESLESKVNETKATVKFQLKKVLCMGVAVGNLDMEEKQIFQNVQMSVNFLVSLLKKNWQNVRLFTIFLLWVMLLLFLSFLLSFLYLGLWLCFCVGIRWGACSWRVLWESHNVSSEKFIMFCYSSHRMTSCDGAETIEYFPEMGIFWFSIFVTLNFDALWILFPINFMLPLDRVIAVYFISSLISL